VLVLHGGADPILPPEMRATVFEGARRNTLAEGGHLLPITHPDWCAAQIRAILP
jgi:pimeloyl-[acyl-carrier protein] methyl ester esterase